MEFDVDSYSALPCETLKFIVNGIDMSKDDFGEQESDGCPDEDCNCYGCHNNHFVAFGLDKIKENLKDKIILNDKEIEEIVDKLEDMFNVGDCGWCS